MSYWISKRGLTLVINKYLCTLQFRTQRGLNEELLVKHFACVFSSPQFWTFLKGTSRQTKSHQKKDIRLQREFNTKRPSFVFFLGPTKPFSSWFGKQALAIQCQWRVEKWQVGPKHYRGGWGTRGNDDRKQNHWPMYMLLG